MRRSDQRERRAVRSGRHGRSEGTGSLLEIVDMMCDVTEKLADIVRKQAVLIEQERIAGAVFPADLSEERKQAEDDLDRIEMKLRRI